MNVDSEFKENCEGNPYSPDNNKACSQLQKEHDLNIAITVSI